MTQPINYPRQENPAYSGITINITNPTLNPPVNYNCPNCQPVNTNPIQQIEKNENQNLHQQVNNSSVYNIPEYSLYKSQNTTPTSENMESATTQFPQADIGSNSHQEQTQISQEKVPPTQYYLNNYNYIEGKPVEKNAQTTDINQKKQEEQIPVQIEDKNDESLQSSKEIIDNINTLVENEKNTEKNSKKVRVVALTNEYIMSLENHLNNPKKELRIMASKEILNRLGEDSDRYDDAALNALLNKMLQDPEKIIRIAALSALSSELACGNDYTIELLKNIQNNPKSDKEDAVQAANILLKMAATTEVRYTPIKNDNTKNKNDNEPQEKQIKQLQEALQKYKEKEIEKLLESDKQQQANKK